MEQKRRNKLDQIYDVMRSLIEPRLQTHVMCMTFLNVNDLKYIIDLLQSRQMITMNQDKRWELTEQGVEALALMDQLNRSIGLPSKQQNI